MSLRQQDGLLFLYLFNDSSRENAQSTAAGSVRALDYAPSQLASDLASQGPPLDGCRWLSTSVGARCIRQAAPPLESATASGLLRSSGALIPDPSAPARLLSPSSFSLELWLRIDEALPTLPSAGYLFALTPESEQVEGGAVALPSCHPYAKAGRTSTAHSQSQSQTQAQTQTQTQTQTQLRSPALGPSVSYATSPDGADIELFFSIQGPAPEDCWSERVLMLPGSGKQLFQLVVGRGPATSSPPAPAAAAAASGQDHSYDMNSICVNGNCMHYMSLRGAGPGEPLDLSRASLQLLPATLSSSIFLAALYHSPLEPSVVARHYLLFLANSPPVVGTSAQAEPASKDTLTRIRLPYEDFEQSRLASPVGPAPRFNSSWYDSRHFRLRLSISPPPSISGCVFTYEACASPSSALPCTVMPLQGNNVSIPYAPVQWVPASCKPEFPVTHLVYEVVDQHGLASGPGQFDLHVSQAKLTDKPAGAYSLPPAPGRLTLKQKQTYAVQLDLLGGIPPTVGPFNDLRLVLPLPSTQQQGQAPWPKLEPLPTPTCSLSSAAPALPTSDTKLKPSRDAILLTVVVERLPRDVQLLLLIAGRSRTLRAGDSANDVPLADALWRVVVPLNHPEFQLSLAVRYQQTDFMLNMWPENVFQSTIVYEAQVAVYSPVVPLARTGGPTQQLVELAVPLPVSSASPPQVVTLTTGAFDARSGLDCVAVQFEAQCLLNMQRAGIQQRLIRSPRQGDVYVPVSGSSSSQSPAALLLNEGDYFSSCSLLLIPRTSGPDSLSIEFSSPSGGKGSDPVVLSFNVQPKNTVYVPPQGKQNVAPRRAAAQGAPTAESTCMAQFGLSGSARSKVQVVSSPITGRSLPASVSCPADTQLQMVGSAGLASPVYDARTNRNVLELAVPADCLHSILARMSSHADLDSDSDSDSDWDSASDSNQAQGQARAPLPPRKGALKMATRKHASFVRQPGQAPQLDEACQFSVGVAFRGIGSEGEEQSGLSSSHASGSGSSPTTAAHADAGAVGQIMLRHDFLHCHSESGVCTLSHDSDDNYHYHYHDDDDHYHSRRYRYRTGTAFVVFFFFFCFFLLIMPLFFLDASPPAYNQRVSSFNQGKAV